LKFIISDKFIENMLDRKQADGEEEREREDTN
jgi:hypothetical protein